MSAEEDMGRMEGVLVDAKVLFQATHDPRGVAMLQAMTVGAVPHQFPVEDLSQLVDLPIDDGIVLATTETIGGWHAPSGDGSGVLTERPPDRNNSSTRVAEPTKDGEAVL